MEARQLLGSRVLAPEITKTRTKRLLSLSRSR
jgi:hypothetical protein